MMKSIVRGIGGVDCLATAFYACSHVDQYLLIQN